MICPKCKEDYMQPDHDRISGVESYACWKCGERVYPMYPRREPSNDDLERSPNLCQMHNTSKARRESGNKHRSLVPGFCRKCHEPFEGGPNRKYCDDCMDIVKTKRNRTYYINRRQAA